MHLFVAAALAGFVSEAAADTAPAAFPSLTTIYVGTGVMDNGVDIATTFHCTNVSGVGVSIRFLLLGGSGIVLTAQSQAVAHGATVAVSTRATSAFFENLILNPGIVDPGGINIEATNSAVFCKAIIHNSTSPTVVGVDFPLVRVNPHPGTAE
jgi:hypothetical protein